MAAGFVAVLQLEAQPRGHFVPECRERLQLGIHLRGALRIGEQSAYVASGPRAPLQVLGDDRVRVPLLGRRRSGEQQLADPRPEAELLGTVPGRPARDALDQATNEYLGELTAARPRQQPGLQ